MPIHGIFIQQNKVQNRNVQKVSKKTKLIDFFVELKKCIFYIQVILSGFIIFYMESLTCPLCDDIFNDLEIFLAHSKNCATLHNRIYKQHRKSLQIDQVYFCLECWNFFDNFAGLNTHRKNRVKCLKKLIVHFDAEERNRSI